MVSAPEGRKVGSLKRRARSHLARWEMKICTRREGHFEVKMYKALHVRTTFGSWHVEKVHAVVAWSMFSKSKRAKQTMLFWKLRCSKSARRCGVKHVFKVKACKADHALLEVEMFKKCTPLWREAHFEVKRVKNWRLGHLGPLLDIQMSFRGRLVWQAQGILHLAKN